MGRCLFKDPHKRHKDAKAIADMISSADPEAVSFAAELAKRATSAPAASHEAGSRPALLLVGDVANYDALHATDPAAAAKAAARMQQLLGEAVFLFDGQVADPFAPQMIGELPSVDSAIEAARKAEFDLSPEQQGENPLPVRFMLHAGEISMHDGSVVGPAIDQALGVLKQIAPLKLVISDAFLKVGRGNLRVHDAGAKAGVKLFEIVPAEPTLIEVTTAELDEIAAAEEAEEKALAAVKAQKKKKRTLVAAAAAAIVVAGGSVAMMRMWSHTREQQASTASAASTPTALPPATAATPRHVLLQPFAVEGTDPALADRANAIRLASMEVLRGFPEIRISDAAAPDVATIGATLRAGAAGPEIVPKAGSATGPAAAVPDAASGVQSVVQWVASQVKMHPRTLDTPAEALNAFADAVTASAANDASKTDASLRAAIKADPKFLPAQVAAMNFFEAAGKDKDALDAARQVAALEPGNVDALRKVAHAELKAGDVREAFGAYNQILKKDRSDTEALNMYGRYAFAVNDAGRFNAALARLKKVKPAEVAVHDPDLLVASGRMEAAIDKYYDVEVIVPNNPHLALKIGRISVLRRSMPIAELELKKLQTSDPNYGYHILKAYMAAGANQRAEAESELKAALAASRPGDDYWTSAAEIYAMFADAKNAIQALETANARKEPTASYLLSDPLFGYLQSDPRYLAVRAKLAAQQDEMREALTRVTL